MRVGYDQEANVLRVTTDTPAATAASLLDDPGIAVELATPDGHDIVGLIVIGASAYLPFGRGYNAETDILFIGRKTSDPDLTTENGDITGYWQVDEDDPDGFRDPIGIAIMQASKHFAITSGLTK
jgi:uncharacterized protein YuzE